MIATYSAYTIATGEITGKRITAALDLLAINTAPGEAWICGEVDPHGQRVELRPDDFGDAVVPVVVLYQPPEPPATEWVTWDWSADARRWVQVPTLALLKQRAAEPVLAVLAELDAKVTRPAGEIAEAWALGLAPPAAAALRLSTINADKTTQRQLLAQIAAATTAAELAALL